MLRPLCLLLLMTVATFADGKSLAWKQPPPLPDPLGVAAPFAGVSGGALIVAGGANFPDKMPWEGGKKVWHDAVWVLEKRGGEWRSGGKLPRPLAYGVSVSMRDRIFCIGGCDADRHYAEVTHISITDGQVQHGSGALPPL